MSRVAPLRGRENTTLVVRLAEFTQRKAAAVPDSASIVSVRDRATGDLVSEATFPIVMQDVSGTFEGVLPAELEVVAGGNYEVEVEAVKDGSTSTWTCRLLIDAC